MKKAITIIVLILIFAMAVILFLDRDKKNTSNKMQITVSTFALYDVSEKLLQGLADVDMLIPFGTDIHTYEMTPQDRIRIEKSKFFIYSGAGLEPWTKSFQSLSNALDMSKYVKLIEADKSHNHTDEHHAYDPHYWLDTDNMISKTKKLRDIFIENFPKISLFETNIADIPEVGGRFNIFSAPSILVFFDGKEFVREGRNVSLAKLKDKIQKIYNLYFG